MWTCLKHNRIMRVLGVMALLASFSSPSQAQLVSEIRGGVLFHDVPDLWSGFQIEPSGADINVEVVFAPVAPAPFGGTFLPAIGGTINTRGDTSHIYADLRWRYEGQTGWFFETGLGVAVHDGEINIVDPNAKALGSRALFHIPAEIGLRLNETTSLSVYFEHTSNAGLGVDGINEGMDRLGVRLGYRF